MYRVTLNIDLNLYSDGAGSTDAFSLPRDLLIAQSLRPSRVVYLVECDQDEDCERVDRLERRVRTPGVLCIELKGRNALLPATLPHLDGPRL